MELSDWSGSTLMSYSPVLMSQQQIFYHHMFFYQTRPSNYCLINLPSWQILTMWRLLWDPTHFLWIITLTPCGTFLLPCNLNSGKFACKSKRQMLSTLHFKWCLRSRRWMTARKVIWLTGELSYKWAAYIPLGRVHRPCQNTISMAVVWHWHPVLPPHSSSRYMLEQCTVTITKKELIAHILLHQPGQTTKQQSEKEVIKLFWEVVVEMGIMWTSNKGVSATGNYLGRGLL